MQYTPDRRLFSALSSIPYTHCTAYSTPERMIPPWLPRDRSVIQTPFSILLCLSGSLCYSGSLSLPPVVSKDTVYTRQGACRAGCFSLHSFCLLTCRRQGLGGSYSRHPARHRPSTATRQCPLVHGAWRGGEGTHHGPESHSPARVGAQGRHRPPRLCPLHPDLHPGPPTRSCRRLRGCLRGVTRRPSSPRRPSSNLAPLAPSGAASQR